MAIWPINKFRKKEKELEKVPTDPQKVEQYFYNLNKRSREEAGYREKEPFHIKIVQEKKTRWGLVLVIFLLIFFGGIFYCQFYPGTCSAIAAQIKASEIARQYTIIKEVVKGNFPYYVRFPEELAQIGKFENPVITQKPTEKRGVIISQFKSFKPFYEEGEKIVLDGLIDIVNVENNLILEISCTAEDQNRPIDIEVVGIDRKKGVNEVSTIVEGSPFSGTKTVSVRCILPADSYVIDFKDKERIGKLLKLNVKYDVKATTVLELYVGDEEQISRIGGEKLLERTGLLNNLKARQLWKGDRQIRSLQIGARVPISPSIQLLTRQPLTKQDVDVVIRLLNTVRDKLEWGGSLDKLNFLELVSLNKEVIINQDSCEDFIDGKLSSQIIKNINDRIERICYGTNKNSEDCVSFRDNSLIFRCGIKIQDAPSGDLLNRYIIQTNTIYTYIVTKDTNIQIRKKEEQLFAKPDTSGITTSAILFVENLLKQPIIDY